MNCPKCQHELVNIIYGKPTQKLIDLAKEDNFALGGCCVSENSPRYYCYGCHAEYYEIM